MISIKYYYLVLNLREEVSSMPQLNSNAAITAIGSYVPERVLTNADLEKLVETNDEWIVKRTGIRERRIAADEQFTSDLIYAAVRNMIDRYGVAVEDVDYIIVATSTPDTIFPSMAARVQAQFNIKSCGAVDIQAACAGFTAAIQLGNGLLLSGAYRKLLIIGAEVLSKITDYSDRTTCILFGDGAGAILMEVVEEAAGGNLLAAYSSTDGDMGHHVYRSSLSPAIGEHAIKQNGLLVQNGREVFRWAVGKVSHGVNELLSRSGLSANEIDWFVPHSANMRIIDAICERTGFDKEQTLSCIEYYGNTSAASIPLALDQACKDGVLLAGHKLLLHGYGGGLTQAGVIIRWTL